MAIARALRLSLIVFLWRTRCNKDLLYLFDIANSHGRTGEQVRGDIENGLKFLHYTYDCMALRSPGNFRLGLDRPICHQHYSSFINPDSHPSSYCSSVSTEEPSVVREPSKFVFYCPNREIKQSMPGNPYLYNILMACRTDARHASLTPSPHVLYNHLIGFKC